MTVEPMTDDDLYELQNAAPSMGVSYEWVSRLLARLDAERTRADAAEAEREKAVARDRERCITNGLGIEELTIKAREWHGSGQQRRFSHANLRDLWEAVERLDRAAQETPDAG